MMLTEETPVPVNTTKPGIDWARLFWMLRQSPLTLIGGVIMLVMLLLMVTSPWIVPMIRTRWISLPGCRPRLRNTGLVPMKSDAICSAACWSVASNPLPPGWRWW